MDLKSYTLSIIFLSGILVIASIIDIRTQRIPNFLTYPAMGVAIFYYYLIHGMNGLIFSAGGLLLGIAILFVPYLMGGMGAGDAKLMGAVGAVVGAKGVFFAFLFTAVVGGVYAGIFSLRNRKYSRGLVSRHATSIRTPMITKQFIPILDKDEKKTPKLCYGVAIAVGTFIYMFLELSGHLWIA